ncbi:MAG: hypothetical protein CW346_16065, partial [Bacillaceae bacterium]|nr:hypothetical protein [Bacillaceae bacterium]
PSFQRNDGPKKKRTDQILYYTTFYIFVKGKNSSKKWEKGLLFPAFPFRHPGCRRAFAQKKIREFPLSRILDF